jgi:polyhydroxybutyrate depolymerase
LALRHTGSLVLLPLSLLLGACGPAPVELGNADYKTLEFAARCAAGEKPGPAGQYDGLATTGGIRLGVRTPRNYDASRAHPLLVVFAPAGYGRVRSEQFAGLTPAATGQGFIVAYSDHRQLAAATFDELGQIPALVARHFCVDQRRIYFAGHSDGGTSAAAVTFLGKSALAPAAIAVSGAGIRKQDLEGYACPAPVSVMVMHSRNDKLFPLPAFGSGAAQWWAACNRCAPAPQASGQDGCVSFASCADGVVTRYCERAEEHAQWPANNEALLAFFGRAGEEVRQPPR